MLASDFSVTTPPELITTPSPNHAREVLVTTLMAIAPAIETELPLSSFEAAFGVEVVEVFPPLVLRDSFAFPRLSSAFLLTSLPPPSLPSEGDAPFADASARVVTSTACVAWKLTAPVAVMLRALPESATTLSMTVSASDTPMPAVLPAWVSPLAVVPAFTLWVACAVTLEAVSAVVLAPSDALVRMVANVIAMAGTIVTLPDFPPASASVVNVVLSVAVMVTAPAPVSGGPRVGSPTWSMPAYTVKSTRFRPNAAPIPTVPVPDWLACPEALFVLFDPAVKLTAPPPVIATPGSGRKSVPGVWSPWMTARVSASTRLRAKAPATPRVPLPSVAPALAVASNACVASLPTVSIVAFSVRLLAMTRAPTPMLASLSSVTLFTASPAPIPTEVAPVEVPSALAVASVLLRAVNTTAPMAMRLVAGASSTVVVELARLNAIAAATVTAVPSSFSAAGVLESFAPPEERPPAFDSFASDF